MPEKKARKSVPVTIDGVTVKAFPDALDNLELVDCAAEYGPESAQYSLMLCRALFGDEGYRRLKDDLRDEWGVVHAASVAAFVEKAATEIRALKN